MSDTGNIAPSCEYIAAFNMLSREAWKTGQTALIASKSFPGNPCTDPLVMRTGHVTGVTFTLMRSEEDDHVVRIMHFRAKHCRTKNTSTVQMWGTESDDEARRLTDQLRAAIGGVDCVGCALKCFDALCPPNQLYHYVDAWSKTLKEE